MESRFANCDEFKLQSEDVEGNEIKYRELRQNIDNYGLGEEDLSEYEIGLLKQRLGEAWKSVLEPNPNPNPN